MTNTSESKISQGSWKWLHLLMGSWVIWRAVDLRWLSDDAFISFRYAKHFAEGHGLVFNIGEYVEGYTNLLWTVVLGLGMMLGFEPEISAHVLSIGALGGMLWLLTQFSGERGWSLSLVLLGGMFHLQIFATSGLETQWFESLIVLTIWAVWTERWSVARTAMVLGMLTRPEGGLIWITLLFIAALDESSRKTLPMTAVIGVLTLLGLEGWRWFYYGEWLPNTFHAKAGQANWSQGWLYVRLFLQMYWFVALGWLTAIHQSRHSSVQIRRLGQFVLLFSTVYCIHVLRVGGDFMMARFALPWAVPLVLSLSVWVQERMSKSEQHWLVPILGAVIAITAVEPPGLNENQDGHFGIEGITNEHIWYTEHWRIEAQRAGQVVQPFLKDTEIEVVIYGAQAMFAYYADLPYALEGMSGLTDHELARLDNRAQRVGHGRKATVPYLQDRGVNLYLDFRLQQSTHPLNQIQLGAVSGSILSYRKETMDLLRARGAEFQDFPDYLDWYVSQLTSHSPETVQGDLSIFQRYYFHFNQSPRDIEIQQQLIAYISAVE